MLGDAGSIASLVGVAVGLPALVFAILQLWGLKGEATATREASEATRRALGRDLAIADITKLNERMQGLKEIHRDGSRQRALDRYPEVIELFRDVRRRHPRLSEQDQIEIQRAIEDITEIERTVEGLEGAITREVMSALNYVLTDLQSTLLPKLEDRLEELIDL